MNLRASSQIGFKSEGLEGQNRLQNDFFLYHFTFSGFLFSILNNVSTVSITSHIFGDVISVDY